MYVAVITAISIQNIQFFSRLNPAIARKITKDNKDNHQKPAAKHQT